MNVACNLLERQAGCWWIFLDSHKRLWAQLVKNRQVPHPKQCGPDGMPVPPDWTQFEAELPDGPPKKGHGPPAPKAAKNGLQMADQMAQQQSMQNMSACLLA